MTGKVLKTKANDASVDDFIAAQSPLERQDECRALCDLMHRLSGEPARMWGADIVGFGRHRYVYDSGRCGEWMLTGFSPRKLALTVYVMPGFCGLESHLIVLGKHRIGKSCLYIKRLADIDMGVLEALLSDSLARMRTRCVFG